MERPTHCPNCSKSCTSHTGPYCHECGEPLTDQRQRPSITRVTHAEIQEAKRRSKLRRR